MERESGLQTAGYGWGTAVGYNIGYNINYVLAARNWTTLSSGIAIGVS